MLVRGSDTPDALLEIFHKAVASASPPALYAENAYRTHATPPPAGSPDELLSVFRSRADGVHPPEHTPEPKPKEGLKRKPRPSNQANHMSSQEKTTSPGPASMNHLMAYVRSFVQAHQPSTAQTPPPAPVIPFGSPLLVHTPDDGIDATPDVPLPPPEFGGSSKLLVKRLSETATLPTRGSKFAAGYDLTSSVCIRIPANGRHLISTGLSIAVPTGTYGRIAPRSGLAVKHGICVGAGVIDEDYRGDIKILLFNHGDEDYWVNVGDRIAQLVLEKIATPEVVEIDELDESERGAGGFGSSGYR